MHKTPNYFQINEHMGKRGVMMAKIFYLYTSMYTICI